MNIKNLELIEKLSSFKDVIIDNPIVSIYGNFAPGDWSRGVFLEPSILRLIAQEFRRIIDFAKYDVIAGVDLTGVPLATAIALEVNKPMVIVREKAKRLGRSAIVGDINYLSQNKKVLLVDDAMAGGETKLSRAQTITQTGAKVTGVAVLLDWPVEIDRFHEKFGSMLEGKKKILTAGWEYYHLLTIQELAQLQLEKGTINSDLYKLVRMWEHLDGWEDNNEGFLTAMSEYFAKCGKKLPQYVIDHFKAKGIDL